MFISNFKQFEAPFSEIFLISNITPESSPKSANRIKLFCYLRSSTNFNIDTARIEKPLLTLLLDLEREYIFMFESCITLGLLIAHT